MSVNTYSVINLSFSYVTETSVPFSFLVSKKEDNILAFEIKFEIVCLSYLYLSTFISFISLSDLYRCQILENRKLLKLIYLHTFDIIFGSPILIKFYKVNHEGTDN